MPDYEEMYHILFNVITDGLWELEENKISDAMILLAGAQMHCEELYIREGEA